MADLARQQASVGVQIQVSANAMSLEENGFSDFVPSSGTEEEVREILQQTSLELVDDHLVEFSETLRTVAKALRQVAEGKAIAKAEAAEWKRKYELERAHNLQRKNKVQSEGARYNPVNEKLQNSPDQVVLNGPYIEQSEKCCGKHGICSHEILWDEAPQSNSKLAQEMAEAKKASFKLCWGCNGEKSGQHKHEIVSFERGNITTAERSSKQILLKWESPPQTVFILTKPNSISVRTLCAEMVRWLKEFKKIIVFVEPRVRTELLRESSYFNFVQTWKNDEEERLLHTKIDLIVTLGGDGTVLWAASMFRGPVPPLVSFSLGSLGFMTPFRILPAIESNYSFVVTSA